jgi:hypothetical protein
MLEVSMGLDTHFARISKEALTLMEKYKNDKYIHIEHEEVAYFRKFWSLLNRFDYGDDKYGEWVEVPLDKIISLREEAKKTILMVLKYLKEQGWEVDHSPLDRVGLEGDYTKWLDECITLKNGVFTESLEDSCDAICNEVYEESDAFLFRKVVTLYQKFSDILEQTNFDTEVILMESDW